MIVGFGATSPATGGDCPAVGSWESWCDCMWPAAADPATNGKCRSWMPGAPWTILGANLRGIPHVTGLTVPDGIIPGGGGGGGGGGSTDPGGGGGGGGESDEGIFGVPKTIALAGAGVLLAGGLVLFLSRRKKRPAAVLAGYRRRKTRR